MYFQGVVTNDLKGAEELLRPRGCGRLPSGAAPSCVILGMACRRQDEDQGRHKAEYGLTDHRFTFSLGNSREAS